MGLRRRLTGRPAARSVMLSGAKAMTRLLILIAVAFVVVSVTIGWMWQAYVPRAPLSYIFLGLTPVLKFFAIAIAILTGDGLIGCARRDEVRVRRASVVTMAVGGVGAIYGEANTHFGVLYHGEIDFAAMAPGRIDSLAILALGLFGAVLVLGILRLRGAVRQDRST